MGFSTKKADWPIVVVLMALVLIPLGAYVGGYYAAGEKYELTFRQGRVYYRIYQTRWQARIFWPAAQVESVLTGAEISVVIAVPGSPDTHTFLFP
jgi:hypothetical protein